VFKNPVVKCFGISYEKEAIEHHCEKIGKFDPVTREIYDNERSIPNENLKQAITHFVLEYVWLFILG
jgi:STIP1 family protein 1